MPSADFVLGFLTGTTIQDAIFILGAYVFGPYVTLRLIEKRPQIVVKMLESLSKHKPFRDVMSKIMLAALDDD